MKSKKIILDIIMFIIMFLLMKLLFTGILLHEILGIVVFILFVIHNLFNLKWIKTMTKNIFTGNKINSKIKLRYFIDILLFIDITIIVFTGIAISQILFVDLFKYNVIFSDIHHLSAAIGFMLIVLHTLLHYLEIKAIFKKKINDNKDNKLKIAYYYIILIGIIILPISVMATKNFINYLIKPFKTENTTEEDNSSDDNDNQNSNNTTSNNITTDNDSTDSTKPTLEEYLSKLHCNGCSRHCLLTAISCTRGNAYVEEATENYYELYGTAYNIEDNIELDDYTIIMS